MILGELGMPSIPSLLSIPRIAEALDEAGRPQQDWLAPALKDFLDEFAWYARALKQGRAGGTPVLKPDVTEIGICVELLLEANALLESDD